MSRYAIGDVHGCLLTLRELIERRLAISKTDLVVLLGDYVDRGPSSKGVLDYIEHLIDSGYKVVPLRGNHDDMMIRARYSARYEDSALRNGGVETLRSFGVDSYQDVPIKYLDIVDQLPMVFEQDDVVCLHASFNREASDPLHDYESILWKRLEDDNTDERGRRIICGHTPVTEEEMRRRIDNNEKIIVDAGCVYYDRVGYGQLAAIDLDSFELTFQQNIDTPIP